ncbi:MAG: manganese-binding transcriptional regulator MntR [Pseudomonadota bacterium]
MSDDDAKTEARPTAVQRSAARYQRVREAHQTEVAEDYVELIDDLISERGEARVVDLAERLGVTNATVNNTVQRLVKAGYVRSERYRSIFLTDTGHALAAEARARHVIVRTFLIALGVDPEVADADAEGIEHHVSEETLKAFARFVERNGR